MGKNLLQAGIPIAAAVAANYFAPGSGAALAAGQSTGAAGAANAANAAGSAGLLGAGDIGASGVMGLDAASQTMAPGMGLMGDGVSVGKTIEAAGLTPNSFTGGYDSLGTLGRLGQRVTSGFDAMDTQSKLRLAGNIMGRSSSGQPQPMGAAPMRRQQAQAPSAPYGDVYSQQQFQPQGSDDELLKYLMARGVRNYG